MRFAARTEALSRSRHQQTAPAGERLLFGGALARRVINPVEVTTHFQLRSLAFDVDGQGCRFDAIPAEFQLLGRGTPELIRDFLLSLHIEAEPTTWSVTPFCSYYYQQPIESHHFRDEFPLVFEVRVRFAAPFGGPRPDPFRQEFSSATDPTWNATKLPPDWNQGRVLIVTDCFRRTREELLASLDARPILKQACQRVELVALREDALQLRMDVGELTFPDDAARIYSWMEEASYFCRSFTWTVSTSIC